MRIANRFRIKFSLSFFLSLLVAAAGGCLRVTYLQALTKDLDQVNFGGDACHHYNIAWNIAHGRGPFTDFIFSYWFHHPTLPALTDIYPPGVHYVLGLFMTFFGDSYGTARLTCLLFGSVASCVVYFLARRFVGRGLALLASAIIALNPVHIEHSTVVMSPVIGSFFVWLTIALFLRYSRAYVWKGFLAGWSHLCMSALGPVTLGFLLYETLRARAQRAGWRNFFRRFALYLLGAGLSLAPWAIQTFRYFGKPMYTNFAFYPFAPSWLSMHSDAAPPSAVTFIHNAGGIWAAAGSYLQHFLRGFRTVYKTALPLSTPDHNWVTVINLLFLGLGVVQLWRMSSKRAGFFLSCFLSFLLLLSIGSTANEGVLSTRHVLVFVPFVVILWVLGLQFVTGAVKQLALTGAPGLLRFGPYFRAASYALTLLGLVAATWSWSYYFRFWRPWDKVGRETPFSEIYAFHYFWSRSNPELEEAGRWIRTHTSENAVFMYGFTPQDFWGVTRRKVIADPVYAGGKPERAVEEANFYNVEFLAVDSSKTIYDRSAQPADITASYSGLKLSPVWKNQAGSFVIYKIGNEYRARAP